MPVRKIPRNHLVVTGRLARGPGSESSADFEGLLEKDLYILLRDDPTVAEFEVQPVRVPVPGGRPYVPDVLVTYHVSQTGAKRPRELIEVKPRRFLDKRAEEYAPRFAAATAYAAERGWIFRILDETSIRTARLENIRFLSAYKHHVPSDADRNLIAATLSLSTGQLTPRSVLDALAVDQAERSRLLPVLWHMVSRRSVLIDMDVPITNNAPIRLIELA